MAIDRTSTSVEKKEKHKYILDAISNLDECEVRLRALLKDIGNDLPGSQEVEQDITSLSLTAFLAEAQTIILRKVETILNKIDDVRVAIL